jgi:hypothetical protein
MEAFCLILFSEATFCSSGCESDVEGGAQAPKMKLLLLHALEQEADKKKAF